MVEKEDVIKLGEIIHLIFEYNMTNSSGKLLDLVIADADESALRQYRKIVKDKSDELELEIKENAKQLNDCKYDFVKINDDGEAIAGNFDEYIRIPDDMILIDYVLSLEDDIDLEDEISKWISRLHDSYNRAVRRG